MQLSFKKNIKMAKVEHTCIKPACGNKYEDDEVDAYYCNSCREANKKLAIEIDAKVKAQRPKEKLKKNDEIERWKREGGFMPILR